MRATTAACVSNANGRITDAFRGDTIRRRPGGPPFFIGAGAGVKATARKGRSKRKRAFPEEGPSEVARLAGFEPTTPWFVAKYSIQLSYSRTQSGTASTVGTFYGGKTPKKMARLAGFEPTTPWFVAKYSIQLSYSRTRYNFYNFELKGPSVWKALEKVARLAGFEPTTPWFVAKYSIQLSYSRTQKRNYSRVV